MTFSYEEPDGTIVTAGAGGTYRLIGPPPQREFRLVFTGPRQWTEPAKGDRIDVGGNLFDVLDVTKAPEDLPDAGTVTLDLKAV